MNLLCEGMSVGETVGGSAKITWDRVAAVSLEGREHRQRVFKKHIFYCIHP